MRFVVLAVPLHTEQPVNKKKKENFGRLEEVQMKSEQKPSIRSQIDQINQLKSVVINFLRNNGIL